MNGKHPPNNIKKRSIPGFVMLLLSETVCRDQTESNELFPTAPIFMPEGGYLM